MLARCLERSSGFRGPRLGRCRVVQRNARPPCPAQIPRPATGGDDCFRQRQPAIVGLKCLAPRLVLQVRGFELREWLCAAKGCQERGAETAQPLQILWPLGEVPPIRKSRATGEGLETTGGRDDS
jgi:hypothetical protein